jgi:hypothetical protein
MNLIARFLLLWKSTQRPKSNFFGRDLYNLQVLYSYPDKPPTKEQLESLGRLLRCWSGLNYDRAIVTAKADQFRHRLLNYDGNYTSRKKFVEYIDKEYI